MTPPTANQPPPLPRHALDTDRVRQRLWYAAAMLGLLLLLVLLLIAWLLSVASGDGSLGGDGGGGGGETTGRLGAGGGDSKSTSARPPLALGDLEGTTSGNNAQPKPDAKSPTADGDSAGNESKAEAADESGGTETSLLIYNTPEDKQPATPAIANADKPPARGSRGRGKGDEIVDAGGTNPFIGSGPPARSVVYVVDCSGSMAENDKLSRVKSSLRRAIDQLHGGQKFKVFFFSNSHRTDTISQVLLTADAKNKANIGEWIEQQLPAGSTNPVPAMLEAIKLKPVRIVLMSDGQFDPSSVDIITQANRHNGAKKARIDCVGLVEVVATLREIARRNQGVYYQVN